MDASVEVPHSDRLCLPRPQVTHPKKSEATQHPSSLHTAHLFDHHPYLNMKTAFVVLALVAGASAFNGKNERMFRTSRFSCVSSFTLLKMVLSGSQEHGHARSL